MDRGRPLDSLPNPSLSRDWGPWGPPALGAMSPSFHPRTPWGHHRAAPAAAFPHGWRIWDLLELVEPGQDVIYISEQIHVLGKPRNPEACKSIKQAIPTVSLAQVSWLKQESPSGKQGISSCTGNISKALLLLSK